MGNTLSSMVNKTVGGWLLIAVVVGYTSIQWYRANQKKANKQNARLKGRDVLANQPKKDNKAKKQRVETFATQAKSQAKSSAAGAVAQEPKAAPVSSKSKGEIDDRTFAQQMANNKQNKFVTKTASEQKHKQKSVKQSKAKKVAEDKLAEPLETVKNSTSSSVVDADAENDQSPITSPSVCAVDETGVSDMLEQPSAGPSVLRLTNTEEKPKKAKKAKAPEPTETKKQRQNRQKREQEKFIREELEKARKIQEEAQRRAARLAEGRPAPDGVAFEAAQKANAWAGKAPNGVSHKDVVAAAHEPLDTFEPTSESTVKAPAVPATTNGEDNKDTQQQNGKKSDWAPVGLSEEEQLAMLEAEAQWKPVETKKAKKARKTNVGIASSDEGSVNETAAPAATTTAASKPKTALTNGRPQPQMRSTESSFAALADDGADLEDEEAQEWDV